MSPALSERECQIGVLLAQGMTNREIAKILFVTPNTVKTHLRRMYVKLSVRNRVECVNAMQAERARQAARAQWLS